MKTFKLFAYAVLAGLSFSFAACSDDDTTNDGELVKRGDKCRIESFTLKLSESETLRGDVYDYDKSIDLAYTTPQLAQMQLATATIQLSQGATITPDPSVAADYTQSIEFTVTSVDGKTTRIYKTNPVEKVVVSYTKIGALASKTATEMGVADFKTCKGIGVSGDKVVIGTKVFDGKTLAAVGDLNMSGCGGLKLAWLANDEVGHLIATANADGNINTVPTTLFYWKNGFDKPAEKIFDASTSAIAGYLSVGGNLEKGKALISAIGARTPTGPHFCWEFTDGARSGYYGSLETKQPSNDGNWTQQISACSGEVTGTWFMRDAIQGGSNVCTWTGWDGKGTINLTPIPGKAPNGPNLWGNLTNGSVRAFTFNGKSYAALFTTGWPCTYISVVDSQGEFLLDPNEAIIAAPYSDANPYCPVGTFVFNAKEKCGYVYALIPGHAIRSWKLEIVFE